MNIKSRNYNNLLELFLNQFHLKNKNEIFLQSLKNQNLKFSWQETFDAIQKFSHYLDKYISANDRCLLISENRPEWLIADMSIMLSKGISVPAYITYMESDYEFLINDCKPAVIIVSDNIQFKKIENIIQKYSFIKKIISFENIEVDKITSVNKIFNETNYKEKNFEYTNLNRKNIACIIYTSGTQGNPKGVMSHSRCL